MSRGGGSASGLPRAGESASAVVREGEAASAVPRPDARLVPLAAAAWLGAWVATGGSWPPVVVLAGVGVVLGVVAGWRRWRAVVATALCLLAAVGVGTVRSAAVAADPLATAASQRSIVEVEAEIAADPRLGQAKGPQPAVIVVAAVVVRADVGHSRTAGRVSAVIMATDRSWLGLAVGARVGFVARASPADPGEPVAAILRPLGGPRVLAPPPPHLRLVNQVRAGLQRAVAGRPAEQRALLPALVVGDTSRISPELAGDFRVSALTHLTAVSGANLTLLLAFLLPLARACGVRGWGLRAVAVIGVGAFVLLCRGEPSVVRAAAMGLVGVVAVGTRTRDGRGLRHLAVAVAGLILIVDPWLSRSWGFVLSVAASAGIIWWASRWAVVLARWLPRWLAEAVAVPLAAQLATQPLVTILSGQVSVVGLLANMAAGPLVGPATVVGLLVAALAVFSVPVAAVAAIPAGWCAQGILLISHVAAAAPGAAWTWPVHPWGIVVLVAASAGMAWLVPRVFARPWLCVVLVVAMIAALARAPAQPGWPPTGWAVAACDVGQGDALVIKTGQGSALVVDTGPDPHPVGRCLDQLGIVAVPLLVLTHDHADHTGGLPGVVRGRRVGMVMFSGVPSSNRRPLLEAAQRSGAQVREAIAGERLRVQEVEWETVAAPTGAGAGFATEGESSAENDGSIVGLITVGGIRVLVTGDLETAGQAAVVSARPDLRCDILKVPHHGSARQDPAFLSLCRARVALVSVGAGNPYGHPTPKTLGVLVAAGMTVLRTDLRGGIAVAARGTDLTASAQRG